SRRQGRIAGGAEEGRLQVIARRLQVQQQPLSDPGLLFDQSRQAARRQIPDRDRQKGVLGLRRFLRQRLHDEVKVARSSNNSPLPDLIRQSIVSRRSACTTGSSPVVTKQGNAPAAFFEARHSASRTRANALMSRLMMTRHV